jgi:hypothetical protein
MQQCIRRPNSPNDGSPLRPSDFVCHEGNRWHRNQLGVHLVLGTVLAVAAITTPNFCFCTQGTDMREHVLLFCLLGLVLTAVIMLAVAPGAVTWALALIE